MSKIEWTGETWNPISGCSRKSAGCENCYAETMTKRLAAMGNEKYQGLLNDQNRFNGVVRFDEKALLMPLKIKKATMFFVNSMADLFHENVSDEWIDKVFAVMALCPQHTFQILTKRAERMRDYFAKLLADEMDFSDRIFFGIGTVVGEISGDDLRRENEMINEAVERVKFPLPNVWLGVSVENQKTADERIPYLLETPAAIRFLSCEPLLSGIEFSDVSNRTDAVSQLGKKAFNGIDWVIVGGESGHDARPVHPDWVRSIRDQCIAAGVPFFFKQWGNYGESHDCDDPCGKCVMALSDGTITGTDWIAGARMKGSVQLHPVGKKKAGRQLDGRIWDEMPEVK